MDFSLPGLLIPVAVGAGLHWISSKCRGRNARSAFRFAAWGSWLLLLFTLNLFTPFGPIFFLNWVVQLAPAAICYLLAANSMVKEMRAQQRGEFTDAA